MEADSSEESLNFQSSELSSSSSSSLSINSNDQSPLQIVSVNNETKNFELNLDALSSILLHPSVKDKPVAIVSIAGDFRKGKSFLLNFFLRYLKHSGSSDWLDDHKEPLTGFSWRGGSERDTTGILMWSQPFIIQLEDDQEIAVLLMDTQGAFDSEYTIRDSATVFALSTMTSSIQVFNLLHNLQEDNLQVLEIFTEYGRLALEASEISPFQKLVFLIRDWSYPYEHEFGLQGGQLLLEKKLAIKASQPPQLQRVRKHIRACFSEIECFLMPYPGSKVATSPDFDGRLCDIEPQFIEQLKVLVPLILHPQNIVVKNIGGAQVTGRQLLEYFKVYINIFKGESMPEPKSMLEATAEANNLAAAASAKDFYMSSMEDICGGTKPFLNPNVLAKKHEELRKEALVCFNKYRKMGGKEFSKLYIQKLLEEINLSYQHFEAQNKSKNMFNILGSPLILLLWCFICFIFSKIFEVICVTPMANLFSLLSSLSLCFAIAYVGLRFGGQFPDFIQIVDAIVEITYSWLLKYLFNLMQNQIKEPIKQTSQVNIERNLFSSN